MRVAYLLLIATVSFSAGCAGMIARCGKDLTGLETKEEVHAQLGEPAAKGVVDGKPFEEYFTRRKIAEPYPLRYFGPGYPMGLIGTLGTIELILVPEELYLIGKRTLRGQTIRVTYDASSAVTGIALDGESLFNFGHSPHRNNAEEVAPRRAGQETEKPPGNSLIEDRNAEEK